MMGAADINGFIPGACQCVLRNETSNEGAAGTVDTAFFKNGLKLTFVLFLAITKEVSLALSYLWTMHPLI